MAAHAPFVRERALELGHGHCTLQAPVLVTLLRPPTLRKLVLVLVLELVRVLARVRVRVLVWLPRDEGAAIARRMF